jgi:CubicO group peptidase (beta-lactamase class C family)
VVTEIAGYAKPGFEAVEDAFRANFDVHGDVGAAFCLYVGGEPVVDVWGGVADVGTGRAWEEDTLQLVFSTTKGVAAICTHLLAQRGGLDLDAPVAALWPEFAAAGKDRITTRDLLSHRAGLPVVDQPISPDEALAWDPIVERLAAQQPVWEPGTAHGYHALTYGWLVGEVVRRATGRTLGRYLADEVAGPLGLELWIGLPEDQEPRVSTLIGSEWNMSATLGEELLASLPEEIRALVVAFADPEGVSQRALTVTTPAMDWNSPAVHAAEIPAANGVTNARSLARMYAGLTGTVEGGPSEPLLDEEQVAKASELQTSGPDRCLYFETTFGLGFFVSSVFAPYGGPKAFGHTGAGGSVGFTDPEHGIGFGYVMNRMLTEIPNRPRNQLIMDAVVECATA